MNRIKVLLIDDEESLTRLLKRNLDRMGRFEVRAENSALFALSTAKEFEPDLIFLDVMMPELDGGEIAAQLAQHPRLKHVPIIFLTAAVTQEEILRTGGVIAGYQYLAKPVDLDQLLDAIDVALKGSGVAKR
jgi:CheY-like chemotaxis protein